jgi:hypothetical protein
VIIIRPSRVFRWVVRIFLLVCSLSLSAVGLLGGFSAVTILDPDSYNVNIPDGPISGNFNITAPDDLEFNVPFNITNAGFYDLTNVALKFELGMVYDDIPLAATTFIKIFEKEVVYGTVFHGSFIKDIFSGNATNGFITAEIPDPGDIDWTRVPYAVEFFANITFRSSYSLNLYTFTVNLINFPIGFYSP